MIQLFGNCFGQNGSTLYCGPPCASASGPALSARKQGTTNSKVALVQLFTMCMEVPSPIRLPRELSVCRRNLANCAEPSSAAKNCQLHRLTASCGAEKNRSRQIVQRKPCTRANRHTLPVRTARNGGNWLHLVFILPGLNGKAGYSFPGRKLV